MTAAATLTARPAWKALATHCAKVRDTHLRELFANDPTRGERLTAEAAGIFLDYSKNRVTDETLKLLAQLAVECGLRSRIDAMFRGDKINVTEKRAVLHVALRAPEARRSRWTASTSCRKCMPYSRRWRGSRIECGAVSGTATRANAFAMSSTSASAGPTWDL